MLTTVICLTLAQSALGFRAKTQATAQAPEEHLIQGKKYEKEMDEAQKQLFARFMQGLETLQSLPAFPSDKDQQTQMAYITAHAGELIADGSIDRDEWRKLWQSEPRDDSGALEKPNCDFRHSKKRLMLLFGMSDRKADAEAKKNCRFGDAATIFIWHSNGPNVGHVAMLLGPPQQKSWANYQSMTTFKEDEYTPGIGPHKAFSGCQNKPTSWRSGNCFSYVSWWPAAPGVEGYLDTYVASMHDFNSDQEAEGTLPEYIPIDTFTSSNGGGITPGELQNALAKFRDMRVDPDKKYKLLTKNCAVAVGRVLAAACEEPRLKDMGANWKDATGDLALDISYKGCQQTIDDRMPSVGEMFAPF